MTKAKPTKPKAKMPKHSGSTPTDVETFLAAFNGFYKLEMLALRQIILNAHSSIAEGIKWNVPSFRTSEHFATLHLRSKEGIGVVLHLGAKKRDIAGNTLVITDPAALLKWLAKDRALITFRDVQDIEAKRSAFEDILRQWIQYV
jgi:hypothetical protein